MLKRFASEPLVHFFIIALTFFVVYQLVNPNEQEEYKIEVSAENVSHLQKYFKKTWQRDPSKEELSALIRNFTLDEIYYREAMALGLNENDNVIRRRLRQKMEVMLQDLSVLSDPSQLELNEFYQANINRYASEPDFSFQHVYISYNNTPKEIEVAIQQAQAAIKRAETPKGDSSLLPNELINKQPFEINKLFGNKLLPKLENAPLDQWTGPIKSNLGVHFVKLTDKSEASFSAMEDIKQQVIADWRYQQQQSFMEKHEQSLLNKYQISGTGLSDRS